MALFKASGAFLLIILSLVNASGPETVECPPLWTRYSDSCYRFFGTPKTWQAAENHCREFFTRFEQGHLAIVSTQNENDFLIQLWTTLIEPITGANDGHRAWIGLSDRQDEGTFVWSYGGNYVFRQWQSGQPDGNTNENHENCVDFWNGGQLGWNDENCDRNVPYICEMKSK